MVRGSAVTLCLVMFVSLLAFPVFGDRTTMDIQSKILERFDDPTGGKDADKYEYRQNHRWIIRGSKFITQGLPKFSWVKTWPQAAFPLPAEGDDLRSLGVEAAFDRTGYNYLEIFPVEDQDVDGQPVPKAIPIPGKVKSLDLWVWGSNYKYYMEVQLRDWRGMVHTLRLGDLNFIGWRNLRVEVPSSIPQDVRYLPSQKGLELVKLVLWTYPEEKVNGFRVYFDQPFDGSNLTNGAVVDSLWSSGVGTFAPATTTN